MGSQAEHYLAVVSSIKSETTVIDRWVELFFKWQARAETDKGDLLADDVEVCFPTAIATVTISPATKSERRFLRHTFVFIELVKRNILAIIYDMGGFWLRFVIILFFSLFVGLVFRGLGTGTTTTSILSGSAVLFYLVSFLNLSTLAALPSKCHEK